MVRRLVDAVATARVAGYYLTIRPVAVGNASIAGSDNYGETAAQTINVTVQAATLPDPTMPTRRTSPSGSPIASKPGKPAHTTSEFGSKRPWRCWVRSGSDIRAIT